MTGRIDIMYFTNYNVKYNKNPYDCYIKDNIDAFDGCYVKDAEELFKHYIDIVNELYGDNKNVQAKKTNNLVGLPGIKRVISNDPATIVFWDDNTKTVVKADREMFDKEKGLAMAICKKVYGKNYFDLFRKWCGDCE